MLFRIFVQLSWLFLLQGNLNYSLRWYTDTSSFFTTLTEYTKESDLYQTYHDGRLCMEELYSTNKFVVFAHSNSLAVIGIEHIHNITFVFKVEREAFLSFSWIRHCLRTICSTLNKETVCPARSLCHCVPSFSFQRKKYDQS